MPLRPPSKFEKKGGLTVTYPLIKIIIRMIIVIIITITITMMMTMMMILSSIKMMGVGVALCGMDGS